MIKIHDSLEVEYTEKLNNAISEFSVKVAESIQTMQPLEKFYAIKVLIEDLESRIITCGVLQQMADEKA